MRSKTACANGNLRRRPATANRCASLRTSLQNSLAEATLSEGPEDSEAREGLSWHFAAIEKNPGHRFWQIRFVVETRSIALIGSINLKGPPPPDGDVEVGARRRGFATEATRAVIAWAFASPDVRRVSANVPEDNEPSQAVARRLGMSRTEETRRGLPLWAVERATDSDSSRSVAQSLHQQLA
ncbi:MAG TPA: GNAT family N-acetyltransferase [Thermoanaerobaculia bacterium]|nr:GNAT family N-acetyltransferase [Thermoanaerobaculia bacterium]